MATKNLFAKSKEKAPAKTTKAKDEKTRVRVKDADFFDKIQRLEVLQENQKRDKAAADIIADEIKEIGKAEWSKLYEKTGRNPESIMLESKSGLDTAQLMLLVADHYIKITKDRADDLVEKYGEDIIEEKTTFAFDSEMVEKYGEILSKLIEESEDIEEDEKEKIIKASTSFTIKKGTIDELKRFSVDADVEILDLVEEVKPVISIKNVEVIKG